MVGICAIHGNGRTAAAPTRRARHASAQNLLGSLYLTHAENLEEPLGGIEEGG
jgi:hypothetical protein